jgi:GNAT superfamily N-acetyltransferase
MEIRPVDVFDDDDFHAFYQALRAGELYERSAMPMWSEHDAQVVFRRGDPAETMTAYVAENAGAVVGAGVFAEIHNSNLDKAFLGIAVPSEHRRRGVGTALEAYFAELAAAHGRTALVVESHIPVGRRDDHPHRLFADARGYTLANVEIKRELRLPVDEALLDRLAAEAAPRHRDYRIETFVNDIPPELVESYCDIQGQLALEAPTGDLEFEAEVVTVEAFEARQAKSRDRGLTMYHTLALGVGDEVVAHSVLAVLRDDHNNVMQWATLVRREHRGHRLGLAAKVQNLRAMQAAHPDRRRVITQNSEQNGPMVSINERLGFVPIELCAEFQRFIASKPRHLVGSVVAGSESEG